MAGWGRLIGGAPKDKQLLNNKPLQTLYTNDYIEALRDLRGTSKEAYGNYETALNAATPQAQKLSDEDIGNYTRMIGGGLDYNPAASRKDALADFMGAWGGALQQTGDVTTRGVKLAAARLGQGGTDTLYNQLGRTNALGNLAFPAFQTAISQVNPATALEADNRFRNVLSNVQLMDKRSVIPDRLANRALMPAQASASLLGGELALARDLGAGSKENIAGWKQEKSKWEDFLGSQGEGLDQGADFALDAAKTYLSMYTGGLGGGGGGAKAPSGPPQGSPPAGYSWSSPNFGYAGPTANYGYGGGAYPTAGFGPATYSAPPPNGVLGPGSLGGYNYAAAPAYSYAPPAEYPMGSYY